MLHYGLSGGGNIVYLGEPRSAAPPWRFLRFGRDRRRFTVQVYSRTRGNHGSLADYILSLAVMLGLAMIALCVWIFLTLAANGLERRRKSGVRRLLDETSRDVRLETRKSRNAA